MMIYLFCNESYGKQFLQAARDFSREHQAPVTIVFSDRRPISDFRLRNLLNFPSQRMRRMRRQRTFFQDFQLGLCLVENVNAAGFLRRIRPEDHGIVAGFNQIFSQQAINRFRTLVNFHPSLLPLYRGPVPSYWCLTNNEGLTGFSLHRVTARIDEGEILFQETVAIGRERNPDALDQVIAAQAVPVFRRYLSTLLQGLAWNKSIVDAYQIYRTHVAYASFPQGPHS